MSQEPAREDSGLDRVDIAALHAMTEVHFAATSRDTAPARPDDDAQTVLRQVTAARSSLGQQYVVGPTRLASAKRLILRLSRLWTHHQVAAVEALATADEHLVRMNLGVLDEAERQLDTVRAQVIATEQALQAGLDALAEAHGATDSPLTALTERVDSLESALATLGIDFASDASNAADYVLFEDQFRGTRDEVRQSLTDALRFVAPFVGSNYPVLDIGCGRGEWLELMRDAGIVSYGVDLNEAMVREVLARGLDARHENAFNHLEGLNEESLQAVTAFHVVEHVSSAGVNRMVRAAFRALRPGGRLILETPNPTNVAVGAAAFYLDPTHLRPVHPEYLRFVATMVGFTDVEVYFDHPVAELEGELPADLQRRLSLLVEAGEWALFGPQDYFLAATKPTVFP